MRGRTRSSIYYLLWLSVILCSAEDKCPEIALGPDTARRHRTDVKLIGVGGSENMTILKGCAGTPGAPGDPGMTGSTGSKGVRGDKGLPGIPGYIGPMELKAAHNCKQILDQGLSLTGWYTIYPPGGDPLLVMCDMETDGGGWLVFQRRVDGSVDFYRDWNNYKNGFGNQDSEFWLGNDKIHRLTSSGKFQLRIDLTDFADNRTYALYSNFRIAGEKQNYAMTGIDYVKGNAGDSLSLHKNSQFSTKDRNNDETKKLCAELYKGGWWYKGCYWSHLNGLYLRGNHSSNSQGIIWYTGRGINYSYKVSEMKMRPQS